MQVMSVQTIKYVTIASKEAKALKNTIENAEKLLLKTRFKLGKGYCEDNQLENSIITAISKLNNCSLTTYFDCILTNGVDNEFSSNIVNYEEIVLSKESLYDLWKGRGNKGTPQEFLTNILTDEKANWEDIKW